MGDIEVFGLPVSLGTMIYQAVLFTVLVLVLKRFFLKKIVGIMEKRRQYIENQIQLADSYKQEAEKNLLKQQEAAELAERKAKEIIIKSREDAASIIKEARKEAMLIRTEEYKGKKVRKERGAS